MITPMFTDCHGLTTAEKEGKVQRVLNYVKRTLGNLRDTRQECLPLSSCLTAVDYPNAWPPLQHMWIHSFHQSKNPEANNLASSLAEKWVTSNYMKWRPKQYMYEKVSIYIQYTYER
ncbi:tre-3 [Bugula neritina]|uniref:Trehalase n=1 Tax=Bugula neritina TaxID=10212 RepID=A0A7J7KBZ7_BUGNE|nr:tre-3 [Bugula neritina]